MDCPAECAPIALFTKLLTHPGEHTIIISPFQYNHNYVRTLKKIYISGLKYKRADFNQESWSHGDQQDFHTNLNFRKTIPRDFSHKHLGLSEIK